MTEYPAPMNDCGVYFDVVNMQGQLNISIATMEDIERFEYTILIDGEPLSVDLMSLSGIAEHYHFDTTNPSPGRIEGEDWESCKVSFSDNTYINLSE